VNQLRRLLEALPARERLMVLLDFGSSLRRGELSGVKWEDVDFEEKVLTPMRSIVKQHIGDVKTEASKKNRSRSMRIWLWTACVEERNA